MAVFSERASRRVGAEQHSQTEEYANRWKFTGHELDKETGLYYAGARYYDPRTSIWISVDPLAEDFPSWNPYAYTFQNPLRYVDPDGRAPEDWIKYKGRSGNTQWIYDEGITTVAQAEAKGYRNVQLVAKDVILYNNSETYRLTDKATVTDLNTGREVKPGFLMQDGRYIGENNQLKSIAKGLQDSGDVIAVAGYGLTITGVGAEVGIPLAAIGNGISTAGSFLELGIQISDKDFKGASMNATFMIGGELLDMAIDKAIPGPTPDLINPILRQSVNLQTIYIERSIENIQE